MSRVVTFYSFKGGVGRSMALANVAVLLARSGMKVLVVDWDLEAPGIERYFEYFELSVKKGGLLPYLVEQNARLVSGEAAHPARYRDYLWEFQVGGAHPVALLPSGRALHVEYSPLLETFSWSAFFANGGGDLLESLRDMWKADFDIVLIDSRTGMSDSGGVCTILMPDVLVALFTPNRQSVFGVRDVVRSAQAGRQRLAYDRLALTVLPVPSRFPLGADDVVSDEWLDCFTAELGECFRDWLPRTINPRIAFDHLKIPSADKYSFGERLAVVEEAGSEESRLVDVYRRISDLLRSDFRDVSKLLVDAEPNEPRQVTEDAPYDDGYDHDVFVSVPHSGAMVRGWTRAFVSRLREELGRALGRPARIWETDSTPRAGEKHSEAVERAVARSRVMLALLTPQYFASEWCLHELQVFEERERAMGASLVVPVALRGVKGFPPRILERHIVPASNISISSRDKSEVDGLVREVTRALFEALKSAPTWGAIEAAAARSVRVERPEMLRLLFLAANPVNTSPFALGVEAKEVELALTSTGARDLVKVETAWNADPSDLERVLRDPPDIVHFSGHGSSDGLFFLDDDGSPIVVSGAALAATFRATPKRVSLVVLNACYSEHQAHALREVVDCVVGMGPSITDEGAITFARAFYDAIARGMTLAQAFAEAQKNLAMTHPRDADQPRLLGHGTGKRLVDVG